MVVYFGRYLQSLFINLGFRAIEGMTFKESKCTSSIQNPSFCQMRCENLFNSHPCFPSISIHGCLATDKREIGFHISHNKSPSVPLTEKKKETKLCAVATEIAIGEMKDIVPLKIILRKLKQTSASYSAAMFVIPTGAPGWPT